MNLAENIVTVLLDNEVGGEAKIGLPRLSEIVQILRNHPLTRLKWAVKEGYLVGSFADNRSRAHSDVDILLIVRPKAGYSPEQLENIFRRPLRQYFINHNIQGKADEVHPQWQGRRLDIYFAYDASEDPRPKIKLPV